MKSENIIKKILGKPISMDKFSLNQTKLTIKNATVDTLKRAYLGKIPEIYPSDAEEELSKRGLYPSGDKKW